MSIARVTKDMLDDIEICFGYLDKGSGGLRFVSDPDWILFRIPLKEVDSHLD